MIENDRLRVDALGQATMDGSKGLHVTATGDLAKLGPLLGQGAVSGHGVLTADLTGRWRDPTKRDSGSSPAASANS